MLTPFQARVLKFLHPVPRTAVQLQGELKSFFLLKPPQLPQRLLLAYADATLPQWRIRRALRGLHRKGYVTAYGEGGQFRLTESGRARLLALTVPSAVYQPEEHYPL